MPEALPQGLVRALRKGRLVVFVDSGLTSGGLPEKIKALPCGLWIAAGKDCLPGAERVVAAADIEDGSLRQVPAGTVVEIGGVEALGTPRRPTRFRAWMEEVLRRRTVLYLAAGDEHTPHRKFLTSERRARCVVVTGEGLETVLDQLVEHGRGARPKPPPPLPAVSSFRGVASLAMLAGASVICWLLLYASYGGAQNWRWLQLVPGGLVALAAVAAVLPPAARAMSGQEIPVAECYARALARWSRAPRALATAAFLGLAALAPWWLASRHVPATFLVLFEAAGVTHEGRVLGACRAEEPCALIVPRDSHLHFDGAEAGCGLDLPASPGLVIIDLQQESCEPPGEETAPAPRSG